MLDSIVGASLLAKDDNDNACCLKGRVAWAFFASRLAPTVEMHSSLELKFCSHRKMYFN
jgi:hypothetical protein